ncbi:flagellar basal body-associated FliL family protein [Marivita sp. S6314]|uniref:flagellar basal body-associated FliL family protein n=1 Tax=Marivita sp. S6314 TaxID=2926406 RepID=UPI001FF5F438|nr:flagellar basal body-associated FliL family protein [Marivita sp. S6314]MCK0151405.1 flagellar basal body-associated FliL family protein [Marivita sp. S6314]
MKKILFPVIALVLGLAGGTGAAIFLQPAQGDTAHAGTDNPPPVSSETDAEDADLEIVKLPKQFVVPVILRNRVRAVVILTVALEVPSASADDVRTAEPKLRDTFLDELFELAALDGFKDELVSKETLGLVRTTLTQRARSVLRDDQVSVLVTDMARQDVN